MKIKPALKKTMIMFTILALLMLIIFYSSLGSFKWPPETFDYVLFGTWAILTASFLFVTIKYGYYTLEKKGLYQRRFTKVLFYEYDQVVFIDEKWSRKTNTLRFVMRNSDVRYLVADKKQVLIDEMIKRCKNTLSEEDFSIQYPQVKL